MITQLPIPAGVTLGLLATQTPLPLASPLIEGAGTGATGPFAQGMTAGVSTALNRLASKVRTLAEAGSGGLGVLKGLDLSIGTGLTVEVSPGSACAGDIVDFAGGSLAIAASTTTWIWLTADATLAFSGSPTSLPTGGLCFLGSVTASASSVTGIDYSGRVFVVDGMRIRQTADPFAPGDAPPAGARIVTVTKNGAYLWTGLAHAQLADSGHQTPKPTAQQTLAADLTLDPQSSNLQWLVADGGDRQVILPSAGSMPVGGWFQIVNAGDGSLSAQNHGLKVVSASGALPYVTLTPGQSAMIRVQPPAGGAGAAWPAAPAAVSGV